MAKRSGDRTAELAGTSALVMGIGLNGGGVATAKWLARRGVRVTATDLRDRAILGPSIRALGNAASVLVLGEHRMEDFRTHDLILVNPAVPRESPFLAEARNALRRLENDCSLFFRYALNPAIAVTGTRGKTTTTLWIAELLRRRFPLARPSGNTPENALLKEFDRIRTHPETPAVAELSSWQLEFLPASGCAPEVAVITNLYPDHLNRYGGDIRAYADAKAGIFAAQTARDTLVVNADDPFHTYFLDRHRALGVQSRVLFVSAKPLKRGVSGVFVRAGVAYLRLEGKTRPIVRIDAFARARGAHNATNLLLALAGALAFAPGLVVTERMLRALSNPPMRQEIIGTRGKITVVNDSCATSPDGTIAAIERFRALGRVVLIAGGTDKALEFAALARTIAKRIPMSNLILLDGSATAKLRTALGEASVHPPAAYTTLSECVDAAFAVARASAGKTTIVFAPGAASFEKFLHEFDRGRKFARLALRALAKRA